MANKFETAPNNFGTPKSETRYLDLAGLTSFWAKVKTYVDTADKQVFDKLNEQSDNYNAAIRAYIESLTVNGQDVVSSKTDGVGTDLTVTIGGEDIAVRRDADSADDVEWDVTKDWDVNKAARGHSYSDGAWKIDDAIENIDARLDAVQSELLEGVVSGLNVTSTHGTYNNGTDTDTDDVANKKWVAVTGKAYSTSKQVGDLTLNIDDTAINDQFNSLDEKINFLEANAGVTNIKVTDIDDTQTTNKGLVELSLKGTKLPTGENNTDANGVTDALRRGDIEIILDESVLDDKLDKVDLAVATEVDDRKEDVGNLAGTGYTIAAGTTAGAWSADVSYQNITAISDRLDQIDDNLVTKIVDGNDAVEGGHGDLNAENEKYVSFAVAETSTGNGNDKIITLTLDDEKLQEYVEANEVNIAELADLDINGLKPVAVTTTGTGAYQQNKITVSRIDLTTEHIHRPSATEGQPGANLETTLEAYDAKMTALASATHFRGRYTTIAEALAAIKDQGDVVIIGNKEYVYYDDAVTDEDYAANGDFNADYVVKEGCLVELGDTEAETQRIGAIETWIDNNYITVADINALDWEAPTYTA